MKLSVVVATFGAGTWQDIARIYALPSLSRQTLAPYEIIATHGETLSRARNAGAAGATGDYLCFLDADDELDPNFVEAVADMQPLPDVVQPATLGVRDGVEDDVSTVIPTRDLRTGNYLVVSCPIRRSLFEEVGGFDELPCLEDWVLWLKCVNAGATIAACPEAVLRIHVNEGSRNQNTQLHARTYKHIRRNYA